MHQVFESSIGLIKFEHGKFRIVAHRDAFVAKVAVQFEDPVKTADQQALQKKLRRHPQIELHVEGVVVRDKRPRGGAAGDRLHHRSFNFEEVALLEKTTQRSDDSRTRLENLAHVRIDHKVEITLTIARLYIGQAVPLFRQGTQTFRQ